MAVSPEAGSIFDTILLYFHSFIRAVRTGAEPRATRACFPPPSLDILKLLRVVIINRSNQRLDDVTGFDLSLALSVSLHIALNVHLSLELVWLYLDQL